jgi:uncharacterized protein (TIGR01244 family)
MNLLHDNLYIAGQITEADIVNAAGEGVKVIINNRPDNEEPGQLDHVTAEQICQQHGIEYIYLPMANGQPMPEGLIESFKDIVEQNADKKVLAHCRSGTRCAIIWSLGKVQAGDIEPDHAFESASKAGVNISMVKPILDQIYPK